MKPAAANRHRRKLPEPGVGDPSQSENLRTTAVDFAKRRRAPISPPRCRVLKFSWDRPQNSSRERATVTGLRIPAS
jgi:hypothetical protein